MKKEKKNYLAGLLVTLFWWLVLGAVMMWVEPVTIANWLVPNSYLIFFGVLFLAIFFTFSIILVSKRRGLLMALGVVVWGYLRLWRISNWLNTLLLVGLLVMVEIYFWGKTEKDPPVIE